MKYLSNVCGYIGAGHMLIKASGLTIVEVPTERERPLKNLLNRRMVVMPGDRLVSPADFVQATGCTITLGAQVLRPTPPKEKKQCLDLTKSKSLR